VDVGQSTQYKTGSNGGKQKDGIAKYCRNSRPLGRKWGRVLRGYFLKGDSRHLECTGGVRKWTPKTEQHGPQIFSKVRIFRKKKLLRRGGGVKCLREKTFVVGSSRLRRRYPETLMSKPLSTKGGKGGTRRRGKLEF